MVKISAGMVFDWLDDTHDLDDAQWYEDDHGLVIDVIPEHISIRINPQDFPKLIELMANTMDGMVHY